MRCLLLVALATLVLPRPGLAGWGGETWGTMIWGKASAVPSTGWLGRCMLALGLAATAANSWPVPRKEPSSK